MAYAGGNMNSELQNGIQHVQNPGHWNAHSITLGDEAAGADQGLNQAGAKWNGEIGQVMATPHSVLDTYSFTRNASSNGSSGQNWIQGLGTVVPNGGDGQNEENAMQQRMLHMQNGGVD